MANGGAYLEIHGAEGLRLIPLEDDRTSVGRAEANDVVLADPTVSNLHAVFECFGAEWCVRDVGSSNGTYVNGERVHGDRRLRAADEISMGGCRLVFRSDRPQDVAAGTMTFEPPPRLTTRERDVLVALCRPLANGNTFTQPATIKQLASDLVVSEAAVKFHLGNLYDKFGIHDADDSRRLALANEAIRRSVVTLAELRRTPA